MKVKNVLMLCCVVTCTSISFTACSILPKEEEFRNAPVVKEFEKEEFSMTTVQKGNIRNYENIGCEYEGSKTDTVTLDEWVAVKSIRVSMGDKVKVGDLLVETMSDDIDFNIDEVKYGIKKNKILIQQAEQQCKLDVAKQKLVLNDEVSIKAIKENYALQISGYESELESLEQSLQNANEEKQNYQIRSNIDGVVTYVNNKAVGFENNEVNGRRKEISNRRGNDIVVVSDNSMPYFEAAIDSSNCISKLSENQIITVATVANEYKTRVHFPKSDPDKVYFMLDYLPDDIKAGDLANAQYILEERKDVLYVPNSAVNKMGDSYVVYYEDENGLKNVKNVEVGLIAENKAEIKSGLNYNDTIIVR